MFLHSPVGLALVNVCAASSGFNFFPFFSPFFVMFLDSCVNEVG